MQYYVSKTERIMRGWGLANERINKFIVICDNFEQAETIERLAKERPEMKYINICCNKPNLPKQKYLLSFRNFDEINWRGDGDRTLLRGGLPQGVGAPRVRSASP